MIGSLPETASWIIAWLVYPDEIYDQYSMNAISGLATKIAGSAAIGDFARNVKAGFNGYLCNLLHDPKWKLQSHATGDSAENPGTPNAMPGPSAAFSNN